MKTTYFSKDGEYKLSVGLDEFFNENFTDLYGDLGYKICISEGREYNFQNDEKLSDYEIESLAIGEISQELIEYYGLDEYDIENLKELHEKYKNYTIFGVHFRDRGGGNIDFSSGISDFGRSYNGIIMIQNGERKTENGENEDPYVTFKKLLEHFNQWLRGEIYYSQLEKKDIYKNSEGKELEIFEFVDGIGGFFDPEEARNYLIDEHKIEFDLENGKEEY